MTASYFQLLPEHLQADFIINRWAPDDAIRACQVPEFQKICTAELWKILYQRDFSLEVPIGKIQEAYQKAWYNLNNLTVPSNIRDSSIYQSLSATGRKAFYAIQNGYERALVPLMEPDSIDKLLILSFNDYVPKLKIVETLLKNGAHANLEKVISYSVAAGDPSLIKLLVKHGADPSIFLIRIMFGQENLKTPEMVNFLLGHGAQITLQEFVAAVLQRLRFGDPSHSTLKYYRAIYQKIPNHNFQDLLASAINESQIVGAEWMNPQSNADVMDHLREISK